MKTRSKIWLGVGVFALASAGGLSLDGNRPTVTFAQPAQAADGTCGWEINERGNWIYDRDCQRGERYQARRGKDWEQGENWERGERWNNERGWERGRRDNWNERGEQWQRNPGGRDPWGERGERG
ncbi:MAG: hypothetical protein AB7R90_02125 [Reyranellaceae bacterium]